MRGWSSAGRGRLGLYALAVLAVGVVAVLAVVIGTGILSGAEADPAERAIQPAGAQETAPEPVDEDAARTADDTEPKDKADQVERAIKEPEPEKESASSSASASSSPAAVPADSYMTLTVPAMGIADIPVVEGTTEASLSQGAGHYIGSGYPWIPGSNTYIAGHRLGYPGTPSDHVFWNLPNLVQGDEIYLTDTNGHTYTYTVSEILEVPINDLSVTGPTGASTVSLQTCIEDYGDYWTPGPNWTVRYIVRGTMV